MGMPITIEIIDEVKKETFAKIFDYFKKIDQRFSTYKENSEISLYNRGKLKKKI